jgi:ABC-type amino acid transport substrate-binding protein
LPTRPTPTRGNSPAVSSSAWPVGFSNITVTQERKEKYDFAIYREDNLGFGAKKGSGLKVSGPEDVAGRTVAVSSGTNQEKLLIEWSKEKEKAGRKPVNVKYYQNDSDTYLALQSGRIDLYLGPNPNDQVRDQPARPAQDQQVADPGCARRTTSAHPCLRTGHSGDECACSPLPPFGLSGPNRVVGRQGCLRASFG